MRKVTMMAAGVLLAFGAATTAAPAFAGQPGPGDQQCVPGQQGNPHPGFKAGVCANGG